MGVGRATSWVVQSLAFHTIWIEALAYTLLENLSRARRWTCLAPWSRKWSNVASSFRRQTFPFFVAFRHQAVESKVEPSHGETHVRPVARRSEHRAARNVPLIGFSVSPSFLHRTHAVSPCHQIASDDPPDWGVKPMTSSMLRCLTQKVRTSKVPLRRKRNLMTLNKKLMPPWEATSASSVKFETPLTHPGSKAASARFRHQVGIGSWGELTQQSAARTRRVTPVLAANVDS